MSLDELLSLRARAVLRRMWTTWRRSRISNAARLRHLELTYQSVDPWSMPIAGHTRFDFGQAEWHAAWWQSGG
jgi:hypothetical protein